MVKRAKKGVIAYHRIKKISFRSLECFFTLIFTLFELKYSSTETEIKDHQKVFSPHILKILWLKLDEILAVNTSIEQNVFMSYFNEMLVLM